jgi:hypothetical protein
MLAKRKQRHARRATASAKTPPANPLELVIQVKEMLREVGGITNLRMLADLMAE